MDIRLMDTPEQVEAFAAVLRLAFDVVEESGDYPNRGASLKARRYMDLRLRPDAVMTAATAPAVATAVAQLLAEVEAALGDDLADRTYALESVERQLIALLGVIAAVGGG